MRTSKSPRILIALGGLAASASSGFSDTWDNSAGNAQWSTATNWADNTEPTQTDAASFPSVIPLNQATILMTTTEFCSNLTFSNDYTLQGGQMFIIGGGVDVASGRTATINTVINGSAGLTKTGGGTLRLLPVSSNAFSGPINITGFGSTLYARSNVALGNTANDITISGGRLQLDGITNPTFLVSGRTITAGALGATIELLNNAFLDLNQPLGANANPITFTGSGSVELNSPSARTGSTFVSVPLLRLNSATGLGTPGSVSLSNGSALEINNGSGIFTGIVFPAAGTTIRGGTGTHTFDGSASFSGPMTLNGGPAATDTLILGSNGASVWNGGSGVTTVNMGTVQLNSANNYVGDWTINGALQVNHPGSLGTATTPILVGADGRLILNTPTFARDITMNRRLGGIQLLQNATLTGHTNFPDFGPNLIVQPFVGDYDVTLTGPGSSLNMVNAIMFGDGDGKSVRVLNGAHVTSQTVFEFGTVTLPGVIVVNGAGSRWDCSSYFQVSHASPGSLSVQAGGSVSADTFFAGVNLDAGQVGSATITGAGSTLTCTNTLWAGYASFLAGGIATFSVLDGADVTSGAGMVGFGQTATTATVSGPGSSWVIQNLLALATNSRASATLNVANGGELACSGLFLGDGTEAAATLNVTGQARLTCGSTGVIMSQNGAASTIILNGGIIDIAGNITDGGPGVSTFTLDSATLDMHNFAIGGTPLIDHLQFRSGTLKNVSQINDGAGLAKTGPGVLHLNTPNTYDGPTTVSEGTLFVVNLDGSATSTGPLTVASGATLAGPGRVGGRVTNDGFLAPEGFVGSPVGTLTLLNDYSQSASGTLKIEIGTASSSDELSITGSATLAGTLEVTLLNGFVPAPGTRLTCLRAASISGTFATLNIPADSVILYDSGPTVDILFPCRADLNGDGGVDFFDYLDFVDAFSAGGNTADFNNDATVDFFDYLDFVDSFTAPC